MKEEKTLEDAVHNLIVDVCEVLYEHGYRAVPIGAVMRLIGIDPKSAATHDGELFKLDDEFEALIKNKRPKEPAAPVKIPRGATIH